MKKIQFNIAFGNSQGLKNDALIIEHALRNVIGKQHKIRLFSGADSKIINIKKLLSLVIDKLCLKKQVTFHLEEIYQELSYFCNENILIPNQEWLRSHTQKAITNKTHIWCKTQYAVKQLSHLNNNVSFLGFCSRDMNDENIQPDFNKFIHIAGKSEQKGTTPLLDVWKKHPEWPTLTVISRRDEHLKYQSNNIHIIAEFISEEKLKMLINSHGIHLCPSESEGFGHNIVEALSVGAIVLTTNAPPMNELINFDANCLIDFSRKETRYFSELFFVSEITLENSIAKALGWSDEEKLYSGRLSLKKYNELNANFHSNISLLKKHSLF
ncbi:MAG: glycosyltransferase [Thalassotalea sp.]